MNEAKKIIDSLSCKLEDGSINSSNHYATLTHWANYRKEKAAEAAEMAKVTYTPTNAANHVVELTDAQYIIFDSVYFYANYNSGSGNNIFANVVKVNQSQFITFRNCILRSKKTTASSTNANLLLLGDENRYITVNNCLLDSGYYAVRSLANNASDKFEHRKQHISGAADKCYLIYLMFPVHFLCHFFSRLNIPATSMQKLTPQAQ